MHKHPFEMTLDLNVLNHLGINLYSNNPAVLAEAVANAWDADAETVRIDIDPKRRTVVIADDGHGMSAADVNAKYLRVGRSRREEEPFTPRHGRPVMGRKGIGKLSLFSMANTIEVQSCKDEHRCGFTMSLRDIESTIGNQVGGTYHPEPLADDEIVVERGTRITLLDPRKKLTNVKTHLRRRIARRFSVIGARHCFRVFVNGEEVGVQDRHYYPMLQYVWHYGAYGEECLEHCNNAERTTARQARSFEGWIGTVKTSGQLQDRNDALNRIVVMARGKLVQEDILESIDEAGIYTKYLIGEVQAESLDEDDGKDIATTNRQALVEDDPRFLALKQEIVGELACIRNQWTRLRNEDGAKAARENEAIRKWFDELGRDDKARAKRVFGKINEVMVGQPEQRAVLFKYSVLAFEHLKAKENLDALDGLTGENIVEFGKVFGDQDDLEASFYHQIVQGRIRVIRALQEMVDDNDFEKIIQRHIFDHLWLLDPSWERAATTEYMESRVAREFEGIDADLSDEERRGRVDIKYRTAAGSHVLVELKRAGVSTETFTLAGQVERYRVALRKLLDAVGEHHTHIDTVCVVGKPLKDWANSGGRQESVNTLSGKSIRVVTYAELIQRAHQAYQSFLEKSREAGRIIRLLDGIGDGV